ncbi:MAG: hypothetical protein P4L41_11600 [Flavipsychrobacter sp.]|nr:hypothetical protein [Flavipsychrobacter sp.]
MDVRELKEQIDGIRNAMSREQNGVNTNKKANLQVWENRIADIEDEIVVKQKEEDKQAAQIAAAVVTE